jgi:hypothetical protein
MLFDTNAEADQLRTSLQSSMETSFQMSSENQQHFDDLKSHYSEKVAVIEEKLHRIRIQNDEAQENVNEYSEFTKKIDQLLQINDSRNENSFNIDNNALQEIYETLKNISGEISTLCVVCAELFQYTSGKFNNNNNHSNPHFDISANIVANNSEMSANLLKKVSTTISSMRIVGKLLQEFDSYTVQNRIALEDKLASVTNELAATIEKLTELKSKSDFAEQRSQKEVK